MDSKNFKRSYLELNEKETKRMNLELQKIFTRHVQQFKDKVVPINLLKIESKTNIKERKQNLELEEIDLNLKLFQQKMETAIEPKEKPSKPSFLKELIDLIILIMDLENLK